MTDLLWMEATEPGRENPNYIREFRAEVTKARRDWLLLDRTAFYAEGGGQPADTGALRWEGGEARVTHVSKRGVVKHTVEGALPEAGTPVEAAVDWDRRYRHMRAHTGQHVVSAEAHRLFDARTVGSEVDARGGAITLEAALTPRQVDDLADAVNDVLTSAVPVRAYEERRDALEERLGGDGRALFSRLPKSVQRLRVVEIEGVDVCPCAGTHVAETREIGPLADVALEPVGGDRYRLAFTLAK